MSLQWVSKEVSTPYGPVPTLHRAVVDEGPLTSTEEEERENLERELESSVDLLGSVLWNSNSAVLEYLHRQVFAADPSNAVTPPLKGLRIVELGAGVGVLGIALAMGGAKVVVSDISALLPLMEKNTALNLSQIRSKSRGEGHCTPLVWSWGPSVSLNLKKLIGTNKKQKGEENQCGKDMLDEVFQQLQSHSSLGWAAAQSALQLAPHKSPTPIVDYVVICDALYGNPKDWPALLFTLSEILRHSISHSPTASTCPTVILNFCEQRVENVEKGFLALLDQENQRPPWSNQHAHQEEEVKKEWEALKQALAVSRKEKNMLTKDAEIFTRAPSLLLSEVLRFMRGPYLWEYHSRPLTCSSEADESEKEMFSDLKMPICVTKITWRLREGMLESEGDLALVGAKRGRHEVIKTGTEKKRKEK